MLPLTVFITIIILFYSSSQAPTPRLFNLPPLRADYYFEYSFAPTSTPTCRLYSGLLRKDIATSSLLSTPTWQLYCGPLAKYCYFVPTVHPYVAVVLWTLLLRPYCAPLRGSCIVDPSQLRPDRHPYVAVVLWTPSQGYCCSAPTVHSYVTVVL